MKFLLKAVVLFLCCCCVTPFFGQTKVKNTTELQNAIANANAGSTIVLANGIWENVKININKNGTKLNPISIVAETPNQVFLEGNPNISLGGSYIYFEGFVFRNPSNLVSSNNRIEPIIEFRDANNVSCNNCKVSNIKIENFNGSYAQETHIFKWIIMYGQYNEVSYSSFVGKHGLGSIINDNRSNSLANYHKIHHNYFASRTPVGSVNDLNDQDAIRLGVSTTSLSNSYSEIYDNFFYDWSGEVEIISNKSGKNKYYNNTFRDYQGTLTLRHGNECEVYNNFFFANNNLLSGGIRVIGENHKIYNNYIEGVNAFKENGNSTRTTGAINVSNGRLNSELSGYYQVKNTTIVNNTFVNCDYGLRIGTSVKSDLTLAPENLVIANNIMLNTSNNAFEIQTQPTGNSLFAGNITQDGNWDLTNNQNSNQTVSDNLLSQQTSFYRITNESAAVNAAVGNYAFVSEDILAGTRDANKDAGAEEFGALGNKLPYTVADVGKKVGFLSANNSFLEISKQTVNFSKSESASTFLINSNVKWTITKNASWVSVNLTNGENNAERTINVLENTTGNSRTTTIKIQQIDGDLEETITINQSNTTFNEADAEVLSGISVTAIGTQTPNIPENTLDENFTTRWSANATDGSAYITYNLGCKREITSVKIYFHKGNTRTSSFKIETSEDGVSYTNTSQLLVSRGTTVGFEEFKFATIREAQYVRILGFGNSEGSGWNSYEEVQILGNPNCKSLSILEENESKNDFLLYPNPAKNDVLTIKSSTLKINSIAVFDSSGRLLLSKKVYEFESRIPIKNLAKGIYFLKINTVFKRFVVE